MTEGILTSTANLPKLSGTAVEVKGTDVEHQQN